MLLADSDRTPAQIEVWVCPQCGYWREKKTTGVHADYQDNGPAKTHNLVKAAYIYLGEAP